MRKKILLATTASLISCLTLSSQIINIFSAQKKFDKSTKINSDINKLGFEIDNLVSDENYVMRYNYNNKEYLVPFSFLKENNLVFRAPQTAEYELINNKKVFDDVDERANYAYNSAIAFVSSHELLKGIDKNNFGSDQNLTNGMFVQILARLENIDLSMFAEDKDKDSVSDSPESFYTPAVLWAIKNNLIAIPRSSKLFNPNEPITRQDMAAILYAYCEYKNFLLWQPNLLVARAPFADYDEIDDYARAAATKLNWAGVLGGKENNNFKPKDYLTRGETAAIIKNFVERIAQVN